MTRLALACVLVAVAAIARAETLAAPTPEEQRVIEVEVRKAVSHPEAVRLERVRIAPANPAGLRRVCGEVHGPANVIRFSGFYSTIDLLKKPEAILTFSDQVADARFPECEEATP